MGDLGKEELEILFYLKIMEALREIEELTRDTPEATDAEKKEASEDNQEKPGPRLEWKRTDEQP